MLAPISRKFDLPVFFGPGLPRIWPTRLPRPRRSSSSARTRRGLSEARSSTGRLGGPGRAREQKLLEEQAPARAGGRDCRNTLRRRVPRQDAWARSTPPFGVEHREAGERSQGQATDPG